MIKINQLASYAMVFVLVGLVLGFGALIMETTQDEIVSITGCNETANCQTTAADNTTCCVNATSYRSYSVSTNTLSGMDTMGAWQPILAIVIVAGIVITLLLGSFMARGRA